MECRALHAPAKGKEEAEMIFTGRAAISGSVRDLLTCEFCGNQTSVHKDSVDITAMKCPSKKCGKSSQKPESPRIDN